MAKDEMVDWIVCGRAVGRASGWDQSDTFTLMLHDFEPADGCVIPPGTPVFRFENGTVETYNDDGSVAWSMDLIGAICGLPVARTDE